MDGNEPVSLRIGEAVLIETPAGPVRVRIVDVFGGVVRLGFAAEKHIPVWRAELLGRTGFAPALRAGEGRERAAESEQEAILGNPSAYLIVGDLDKPFHQPECECQGCENWRREKGRPTHAELRAEGRAT